MIEMLALVTAISDREAQGGLSIRVQLLPAAPNSERSLISHAGESWLGQVEFDEGRPDAHPALAEALLAHLTHHNLSRPELQRWLAIEWRSWVEDEGDDPDIIICLVTDAHWHVSARPESHSYHPALYAYLQQALERAGEWG